MIMEAQAIKAPVIGIVDNDPSLLNAVSKLLAAHGYATISFGSAEEYLRRAVEEAVDCLLIDINLDGMSGLDLQCTLIMQGSTIPVIFITGRGDASTIAAAIDLHCVAYLHKPFTSISLESALDAALGSFTNWLSQ
jgi:FixJ family two-component response regulator